MTKINREQFRNEFQTGIDINGLSEETKTALENAGISKNRLTEIAHGDNKIEGSELDELFHVMDRFDSNPSDGYLEIAPDADVSSRATAAYEKLKSEYDRNMAINVLRGPQIPNSKPASINQPEVSLFDGHTNPKSSGKKAHHHSNGHKNKIDWNPLSGLPAERMLFNGLPQKRKLEIVKKDLHERGYSFTNSDFRKALEKRDINALTLFIKGKFSDSDKILFSSVMKGDTQTVQALLDAGMNPDVRDKQGRTPLMLAGNNETTDLLLNRNADVTAKDKFGRTALMYQSQSERNELFLSYNLLEKTKAANAIDARDDNGRTALHYAAINGNFGPAQQMIEYGADLNTIDNSKNTPLSYAAGSNHLSLVNLLSKNGADCNGGYSEDGDLPLTIAIRNQNKDIVQALLDNYPHMRFDYWNLDETSNQLQTPLDVAIELHLDDIVDLLKSRGAVTSDDVREQDNALGKRRSP